jgi:threonyl-tRNA synthetase
MKVPYLAVIGKREAESDMVAINVRGAGKEQKPAPVGVDAFIANVLAEVKSRSLRLEAGARREPAASETGAPEA